MADYAYKTILYKVTDNVVGLNVSQNNADLAEYEANHQSSTVKIDGLLVAQTMFGIDKSYQDFDDMVVSPLDWGDVREISRPDRYELYLITSEPL